MKARAWFSVLLAGALFGAGLTLSTMIQPEVILSFLRFSDFGLLLVLGGAVTVTLLAYTFAPQLMTRPLFGPAFLTHPSNLNARTLGGAALFGVGWGLCGVCPGPAIAGLGAGNWPLLWALAGMFIGAWAQGKYFGESAQDPGNAE
jgi:uncharacterized membrane protein YedE/YeeE